MRYKLIKPVNPSYSATQQILTNRGIDFNQIEHYLNTTDNDINSYLLLGEDKLKDAAAAISRAVLQDLKCLVLVDSDCDGMTSAALLINYLYDMFPDWVTNNVTWYLHEGKQHGLNDCIGSILEQRFPLVICPDSASNDTEYIDQIRAYGGEVIVLDHHIVEHDKTDYIIINNQNSTYPNKEFSGVGVTWQFCRYFDSITGENFADYYLDLIALGLTADMVSLRSMETKHLINKGFDPANIHSPFIYYIWQKNQFKLGEHITSWGAAFYIAPFVNALMRSGTQEEKELLFLSMLKFKAFERIPSNKRGHKLGEMETRVEQCMRMCTNVKNRQEKTVKEFLETIEEKIAGSGLLEHKVLLILLEPGEVDKGVAGLVANKLMARYQRPVCILTRVTEEILEYAIGAGGKRLAAFSTFKITHQGSARGCDKVGITEFKSICADTGLTEWTVGHEGAFGLSISADSLDAFISATDEILKDMPDEPIYYVDYIFQGAEVNGAHILDIAAMGNLWGKDIDESLVAIEHLRVTKDMVSLLSADKNPTLRITLPNRVTLMKFGSSQEEYEKFLSEGYVEVNLVGTCNANSWMGNVTPQIMITDYDIINQVKYLF